MSMWEFANPVRFRALSTRLLPWLTILTLITLGVGLVWGIYAPEHSEQGFSVKIMFLHVPAAFMAINIWIMMLVTSLIWLVRRHHVSALAARSAAPIGATMTLIAIVTGAIWGNATWGTYWVWDPRLTSFMILLVFYFGYAALWQAVDEPDTAADLTAILCMVGSVFALLSRYAVYFWNAGLHQETSVPVVTGERSVHDAYWYPLLICMVGFVLLFLTLVLLRTGMHIARRRTAAMVRQQGRGV